MNIDTCRICGSNNIEKHLYEQEINVPFAAEASIPTDIVLCLDCGSELINDVDIHELAVSKALEDAKYDSIQSMFDIFKCNELSQSYLERAFGLSRRTLGRWKRGEISEAGIALLRTIATYPWIAEVASDNFESKRAREALLEASFCSINKYYSASISGNSEKFISEFTRKDTSGLSGIKDIKPDWSIERQTMWNIPTKSKPSKKHVCEFQELI